MCELVSLYNLRADWKILAVSKFFILHPNNMCCAGVVSYYLKGEYAYSNEKIL